MAKNEIVQNIVKDFFDNAIIIDDEFKNTQNIILPQIDSNELGSFPIIPGMEQSAATQEISYKEVPINTYDEFLKEGFVTIPYRFESKDYKKNMDYLSEVITKIKLMVIDWDLKDSKGKMGDTAIKIIKQFITCKKGIKCVVIYTQEDIEGVIPKLEENDFKVNREGGFFEEVQKEEGNSLFGFIFKKEVPPNEIINKISEILCTDKCITLHFMDCANKLEQNLGVTLTRYNAPFEKAIYSQICSSNVIDLSGFLNKFLLTSVLDKPNNPSSNILYEIKREKFRKMLPLEQEKVKEFVETLKIGINQSLFDGGFMDDISKVIIEEDTTSLDILENKIKKLLENKYKHLIKLEKIESLSKQTLLLILLYDNFIEDNNTDSFKKSFSEQLYLFTKLFKYYDDHPSIIRTGSIFLKNKDNNEEYYLCITPFCDTFRPQKVENYYKFIKGKVTTTYSKDDLKNNKDNYFFMAVPIDNERKIKIIKWNFYETIAIQKDDVEKLKLKKIATLKREYIQNVINRYISYQSRAGVDELFFKESCLIDNFLGLIREI